jgi:hypothetical protein
MSDARTGGAATRASARRLPVSIAYTNRKGLTYYLCRGTTRTGRVRYVFARRPHGEPVADLPPGHRISESVNGVVSLVKDVPATVRPQEVGLVAAAVRRHPRAHLYRVAVRGERIEVYEQDGPDADELIALSDRCGLDRARTQTVVREHRARWARYSPILRFRLADDARRTFAAERRSYLGSGDAWLALAATGPLEELARRLVPTLGTEQFFEWH